MKILTADDLEEVSGGSVLGTVEHDAEAVGSAIADGAETAAGAVVGFFKGLF